MTSSDGKRHDLFTARASCAKVDPVLRANDALIQRESIGSIQKVQIQFLVRCCTRNIFYALPFLTVALTPFDAAVAACVTTGTTIHCSGTTSATDAPIAEVPSGGRAVIDGSASASGSIGYAVVGTGTGTIIINNGTLATSGNSVDALEVLGNSHVITNNGRVTTSGDSASAMHAAGSGNTLLNAGDIDTGSGSSAFGLLAEGAENTLTNRGSIVTAGGGSEALSAVGNRNTIANEGRINTSGSVANGIRAQGDGNMIVNLGTVTTFGIEARGIKVDGGTGNTVINRGTIDTAAARAYGIWVASSAGETNTVVNESAGIIRARGDAALQFGAGSESVRNFGVLTTDTGGAAADLGAGDDTFLIGSTSRITGFVDGNAGTDTFLLGGDVNASFDAASIGPSAQYRSFENYEKVGASTWIVTGDNGRTMPWTVREGALMVTGGLTASSVTVLDGALLGGTGTVGSINARSGSTLSPGMNGIGSLAVTGNVLIANGTIYRIDLNPGLQSDRIVAQGTATIEGGTVRVTALPGDYRPGSRWTILTAQGGVNGQFSGVTTDLAFFKPVLTKDGQNVYLALALAANPVAGDRPVIDPFLPVTNEDLPRVLDLTSGEPLVSATTAILVHDDLFRAAVLCRLRCSEGIPGFAIADYAADLPVAKGTAAPVPVRLPQRDWTMWAKAIGSWGSTDASAASHGMERSTAGLVFGADAGLGTPYRLGLAAGYFSTDLSMSSLGASGNVESFHIGAYGSAAFDRLNLRGGLAYAHHEVDMTRSFSFTGFSGTMRSGDGVDSVQAFGEIGYEIPLSDSVILEPFAGLAHVHIASRGVLEEGSVVAVTGDVQSFDTTYTTLGARLIATMPTERGNLTFKGLLGWRHAFGDIVPKASFSYVGDGRPFLISGAPIDNDSLIVEAGLNWEVSRNVTLSVSYAGAMGQRDQEHTVRDGLNIRF